MNVDELTGEVLPGSGIDLVPLNLSDLDEATLVALFPSPVQVTGALIQARAANRRAPAALARYRKKHRDAQRELKIALGLAVAELRPTHKGITITELRDVAFGSDARVVAAQEAVDDTWLELEYARDFASAIREDIDILRSINANLRAEQS